MASELSPEDALRLNVLLSQEIQAVRLDESSLVLHALTDKGEASLTLHPTGRTDRYLRQVREVLSGHALGSPGGYPVFLSRWTRHGQMESASLGKLLLIGEPEALVAVVHSPALTDELARRAWWVMPTIEHARLMLLRQTVAQGRMGKILADFLIEHLPFLQDDHLTIMDTVLVLLASGALDAEQRLAVWRRGKRQNSYYVAFLEHDADNLPMPLPSHPLLPAEIAGTVSAGWQRPFTGQGQAFISAGLGVLERPETQEVVSRTLAALGQYFAQVANALTSAGVVDGGALPAEARAALHRLASVSAESVAPIFARTTAIGSLMRQRIEPVTAPIRDGLRTLIESR